MNPMKGYRLANGVQVRKENFGLLFYDYRGPRLYFVPSKDLLTDTFLNEEQRINYLNDPLTILATSYSKHIQKRIKNLLKMLTEKGLIYEQSIC